MWLVDSDCSTSVGPTQDDFWQALESGRDGLSIKPELGSGCFWPTRSSFHERITSELDRVYLSVKSQIPQGPLGIILASTKGYVEDFVWTQQHIKSDPIHSVLADFLTRQKLKPHRAICVSNACASSHGALYLAKQWLRRKTVDHVLILSVDGIGPFVWKGFHSLGLVTSDVCRPFSVIRSGLQLGEAAVALVLSSKVTSDFEIESVAIDSEGSPVSRPSTSGRSLRRVCAAAIEQAQPDAIVAHGTGTQLNDQIEDQTFSDLFSQSRTAITGSKWCIGHTLGASGAVDVVAAVGMLRRQKVFALAHTQDADPQFRSHYVTAPSGHLNKSIERILVSSLGFGGVHGAICLRRHS